MNITIDRTTEAAKMPRIKLRDHNLYAATNLKRITEPQLKYFLQTAERKYTRAKVGFFIVLARIKFSWKNNTLE